MKFNYIGLIYINNGCADLSISVPQEQWITFRECLQTSSVLHYFHPRMESWPLKRIGATFQVFSALDIIAGNIQHNARHKVSGTGTEDVIGCYFQKVALPNSPAGALEPKGTSLTQHIPAKELLLPDTRFISVRMHYHLGLYTASGGN